MSENQQTTPTPNKEEEPQKKEDPTAEAAGKNCNEEGANQKKTDEEAKQKVEEAKKIKQRYEEETIVIKSPFPDNKGMLDEDGYSDITIGCAERKGKLRAHRSVLSKHSNTMKELFRGHQVDAHCTYDAEANRVEWEVLDDEEMSQNALFQCIKFCYGAPLRVNPMNAAATIDAIFRLKLVKGEEIQNQVERHMVSVAEKDVESGSLMLRRCAGFELSGGSGFTTICLLLAKTVFTRENIEKYKETVVDNCLMELAPVYLDRVDFGNPHKEFSLRKEYVIKHKGVLSDSELRDVICKCQFESLTNSELIEMRNLRSVTKGVTESVVLDAYNKAMSECETRLAQEQKRAEKAEEVAKQCKSTAQPFFSLSVIASAHHR